METESALTKLEELEPTKQSVTAEVNDLATLKRFVREAEAAYEIKDYRKVISLFMPY